MSDDRTRSPRRGMCAAILCLEAITLGLTTPVMISVSDVARGTALAIGLGLAVACLLLAGMLRAEWAYTLGWFVQVAAIALGFVVPLMFCPYLTVALIPNESLKRYSPNSEASIRISVVLGRFNERFGG